MNLDKKAEMPAWFRRDPKQAMRLRFKQAVANFIIYKGLRNEWPKHSIHLSKTILPWLQALDPDWQQITKDQYNPHKHLAHQRYNDTVRNLLNSKDELKKILEQAEEDLEVQTEQEAQRGLTSHTPPAGFGLGAPEMPLEQQQTFQRSFPSSEEGTPERPDH